MSNESRKYEELEPVSRDAALKLLGSSSADRVGSTLFRLALYDQDWHWVQRVCIQYAESPDSHIRSMALQSLGHLARVHGQVDYDEVVPKLLEKLSDPEAAVVGAAENALSDIRVYYRAGAAYDRDAAIRDLCQRSVAHSFLTLFYIARNDTDKQFAFGRVVQFLHHEDFAIRASALDALAELAREMNDVQRGQAKAAAEVAIVDNHWWVRKRAAELEESLGFWQEDRTEGYGKVEPERAAKRSTPHT